LVLGAAAVLLALAVLHSHRITSLGTFSGLTFLGGFLRVAVSFLTGVLLQRFEIHHKVHAIPWFVPAGLLLAILTAPIGGAIFHLLAVFLILPSVLLLGASTTPGHDRLWKVIGDISYPIYLVHYPILILTNALLKGQPSALIVSVGAGAAVGVSEIALALYDAPAREWLSTRLGLRRPRLPRNYLTD
jgi:peptidoglycan/LPS O-acetylase OafA/YrhL